MVPCLQVSLGARMIDCGSSLAVSGSRMSIWALACEGAHMDPPHLTAIIVACISGGLPGGQLSLAASEQILPLSQPRFTLLPVRNAARLQVPLKPSQSHAPVSPFLIAMVPCSTTDGANIWRQDHRKVRIDREPRTNERTNVSFPERTNASSPFIITIRNTEIRGTASHQ